MKTPQKGYRREFNVGLLIIISLVIVSIFSFKLTSVPVWSSGNELVAYFDDSSGLFKNSPVKIAGLKVGNVENIVLDQGQAKVIMRVDKDVDIPQGSVFIPRAVGIMGDKFIEVILPKNKKLNTIILDEQETLAMLIKPMINMVFNYLLPIAHAQGVPVPTYKSGDVVKSSSSPSGVDDVTKELGAVAQDLRLITKKFRDALIDNQAGRDTPVGRIINNIELLTNNFQQVVVENKDDLKVLIASFRSAAQALNQTMLSVNSGKLQRDIEGLFDSVGKISKTIENLEEITNFINNGQGTMGRLIKNEETIVELNRALRGMNRYFNRADSLKLIVNLRPEVSFDSSDAKTYVSLFIQPEQDFGYIVQAVNDPIGVVKTKVTETSINGGPATITETKVTDMNELKFSFQFFKSIYNIDFKVGIFENEGGFGMDLWLMKPNLKLGFEAFDFSRQNDNVFVKSFVELHFLRHFYLTYGINDVVSKDSNNKSQYAGLGIYFNDDNIKSVLSLLAF